MNIRNIICVVMLGISIPGVIACAADAKVGPQQGLSCTYSPDVPLSVTLAGEKVSLDRIDMYERLDRELSSIVYGHSTTMLVLKRANRYFPIMTPILRRNGVPDDFLYLAAIESSLNVRAYSRAKAAGLWQFLAGTAKQYGLEVNDEVDERYDPEKATEAACKYLKAGYRKYGHWATVAASYNAGMGRISGELAKQLADNSYDLYLNEETSRYVFRLIAMKMVLENPCDYGFYLTKEQLYHPIGFTTEEVTGEVPSWSEWAKSRGISYAQLRELNPWIRSSALTNKAKRTYVVKLPVKDDLYRSKRKCAVYNGNWIRKN
ncbi:MAG: transglycosylase SLT domain-containing protein [Muribaculaceae bacterium]